MSATVAAARPSQALRQRRESQRPSLARASTARQHTMDPSPVKEEPKRYVVTQRDILSKFSGCEPSLRVYLYASYFKINDSQDSIPYHSPIKNLLVHIKTKTIPHDMLEELHLTGVPFYDNCLIVEVHNFRSDSGKVKDASNLVADGTKPTPFSIHNYSNFITPSPHVPHPVDAAGKPLTDGSSKAAGGEAVKEEQDTDKENMPAPGQPASQKQPAKATIVTVVLFPTPQSLHTDIQMLATTPHQDMQMYRRNQAAGRAAGNPPTPLTSVPPTPTLANSRSPKRQRMVLDQTNVHDFESEYLNATCPKLYLEPTKSLQESVALIEAMTHPNNQNSPPTRKSRKRTTAELAADEAEAADLQRYMLAGDEWQASKTAAATGGDEGQATMRSGGTFQTFSRFKTLESIKVRHEEAERRKKEEEARLAQAKRQAQAEAEAQKRRDMEANRQAEQSALLVQRQEQMMRHQQQQQAAQQEQLRAAQAQQMVNNAAGGVTQTPQSATQPQFSSPVVRQQTPMASSPLITAHATHPMGGTPMVTTTSNHAAGSPPRPPSAVSHHPSSAMARSASQQQNQPMSRTGTPQMIQGTPIIGSAMPARNISATPQPRMPQTSPTMPMQGGTPIMMQTSQSGHGGTPDQMQMAQRREMQRRIQAPQLQMQGMAPGSNMTPQQLAIYQATTKIQREGVPQGTDPNQYKSALVQRFFQQIQQNEQNRQMANMSPQNAAQMRGGMPNQGMQNTNPLNFNNMNLQQLRHQYGQRQQQLLNTYGSQENIPQQNMQQMQNLELMIRQRERAAQAAQAAQMAQAGNPQFQMNAGMQGQMNMGGQNPSNPVQMQQYQQILQHQRAQQARQAQLNLLRQQGMSAGGHMQQGMMGNMGMMNAGGGNMGGMGMNMQNVQNMQNMGGMNMGNMGMSQSQMAQMGNLNPQQQQQMMMMQMRQAQQAQAQAQMRAQQGGQRPGGDGGSLEWSGV
ncbi:Spt20 family-domain-containing protein [Clohesyomyces aquaticus]|uniref:Spt20 family-domain-containing protein n=1 Tax=Clohesyomyces aquaticus TaxID=1231657 RepID=A0A1Y1Z6R9_9PLEO|nr:Spt20 family-domain-containing protein [Clohesyomyces aquaticus]